MLEDKSEAVSKTLACVRHFYFPERSNKPHIQELIGEDFVCKKGVLIVISVAAYQV